MGIKQRIVNQARKPEGRFGFIMAKLMNKGHEKMANWSKTHFSIQKDSIILDIGCGGGRDIKKYAEIATDGKVFGIDYSPVSVKVAKRKNRKFIKLGRVEIHLASVSSMPFEDEKFDVITAIESYYFWPDINSDLKETYRVLKPGGVLILVNEGYKGGNEKSRRRSEKWAELGNFPIHTSEEFRSFLQKTGYSQIDIFEEKSKGWITIKGTKHLAMTERS